MKRKISVIFLFLIVIASSNHAIAPHNRSISIVDTVSIESRLENEINKILAETGIPSISLTLIKDGEIVLSDAYGYANTGKKVKATKATIYNAGSNFKIATAIAIMQLAEKGLLNIDDPAIEYLDLTGTNDLTENGKNITIRHLLCHHSGISGQVEIVPLWERKAPKSLQETINDITVVGPPGKSFQYCNHCYALLGLIIETVSGKSYQDYIVDSVFKPLGIKNEGPLVPTPEMVEEMALPYTITNNKAVPEQQLRLNVYPAGDVYLNGYDMGVLLLSQLKTVSSTNRSVISKESISDMQTIQFGSNYGLGTGVTLIEGEKYILHSGGIPGFSSVYKINLDSRYGVYLASNAGNVHNVLTSLGELSLKLLDGITGIEPLPSFAKDEYQEIELPVQVLENYVGEYELRPGLIISVIVNNSSIYAQVTGQPKLEIFPYGKNRFFYKIVDAQIEFNISDATVTGLTLYQNNMEIEAKKIESP